MIITIALTQEQAACVREVLATFTLDEELPEEHDQAVQQTLGALDEALAQCKR